MSDLATIRMPFGKHKGERVVDVPKEYLRWLRETTDIRGPLLDAVELALDEPGGDYERWGSGWRKR